MNINIESFLAELFKNKDKHQNVLFEYLVIYLLRDCLSRDSVKRVIKEANDFLKESEVN